MATSTRKSAMSFPKPLILSIEQGRAPLRLREHHPAGLQFSFTFHWLWNSPQGSAGKGGGSLGIYSLSAIVFSAETALGLVLFSSEVTDLVPAGPLSDRDLSRQLGSQRKPEGRLLSKST